MAQVREIKRVSALATCEKAGSLQVRAKTSRGAFEAGCRGPTKAGENWHGYGPSQGCDVVERAACDDRVERARLVELLETHAPEDRALRGVRIDRRDRVSGGREASGEIARSAADLEDARRRRWSTIEDEALEVQLPPGLRPCAR